MIHDGWVVHPWAPEDGGGGISFLDATDPCAPVVHGQGWADGMRESHTLAFGEADGREYLAVDYLSPDAPDVGGVGFWDITDRSAPVWVSELATPGFYYPDSYLRVTFSNFWQGPVVYVAAAFNGIHLVDASDPTRPALIGTYDFDPPHLVGRIDVIGTRLFATSAGTQRVIELDVSDPWDPQPIAGGVFDTLNAEGTVDGYYFASIAGRYGLFARGERAGGPIVYDLTTPGAPVWVGEAVTEGGDGGYVYRQGDRVFQGDSNFGGMFDLSDPAAPVEVQRITVQGDLDTMSPLGNVVVVSVDSAAVPGRASTVFPVDPEPDADPPALELVDPPDGATRVATTARIGASFDEWVERASVHPGSFRVADGRTGEPVAGTFNVQEAIVNFTPDAPLRPDTPYVVSVPAGGVTDVSGNPVQATVTWVFSTGATAELGW